jgi:hypothetical protein
VSPVLLFTLLIAALSYPAYAKVIFVSNDNDGGPGSLRQRIAEAESGDTVYIAAPPGTKRTIMLTSGQLVINKSLTISGPGPDRLTVQRDLGGANFRLIVITGADTEVTLSGIDLAWGAAVGAAGGGPTDSGAPGEGGAVFNRGSLTLLNCHLHHNHAAGGDGVTNVGLQNGTPGGMARGGAVHTAPNSRMTVQRCYFHDNSAIGGRGGNSNGMISGGATGGEAQGGAVWAGADSDLLIEQSTFSFNAAQGTHGGGGTIGGGIGGAGRGGAIYSVSAGRLLSSTLSNNEAKGATGGLASSGGKAEGGGAYYEGAEVVRYSTVVRNKATGAEPVSGAGAQGARGAGGGIFAVSTVVPRSSILADNTVSGPDAAGPDAFGAFSSEDYNLIGDPAGATFTGEVSRNLVGAAPLIGELLFNGGPMPTHLPLPGSPVIDAGACGADSEKDARGVARPQDFTGLPNAGNGCDVGAVELQFIKGDVNMDAAVSIPDVVLVLRYTVGIEPLTPAQLGMGDVNADAAVDVADAVEILRKIVGLPASF